MSWADSLLSEEELIEIGELYRKSYLGLIDGEDITLTLFKLLRHDINILRLAIEASQEHIIDAVIEVLDRYEPKGEIRSDS